MLPEVPVAGSWTALLEQQILQAAIRKAQSRHYLDILAEQGEPEAERKLLEAIALTQSEVVQQQVEADLARGDLQAAENAIPWDKLEHRNKMALAALFGAMMHRAARATQDRMAGPVAASFEYRPEPLGPELDSRAAAVARETTAASRQAIGNLLSRFGGEAPPGTGAIVRASIFLTPQAEGAIANWTRRLFEIHGGAELTDADRAMLRRSGIGARDIARIAHEGLSAEDLAQAIDGYRSTLLRERVRAIVSTWLMQAANEGAIDVWRQAVAGGHIAAAVKVWVTMPDPCPECAAVDGKQVGLDDLFDTPLGLLPAPPMHPRCRCAVECHPA